MKKATEMGAIILPPNVAMYTNPKTVEDIIDHTVGKALDLLDIKNELYKRWK
jgi:4-hydroxy-3-polyprenylbenzoate decarboxylase